MIGQHGDLVDDDGLVIETRQVPVPPPLPILARLNLLEERSDNVHPRTVWEAMRVLRDRIEALEKAFEGFEFHLAEMDPPPLLAQTLPVPGTVYTRAKCEHCGRFSTVDVGAKLSACLVAFRDARTLAEDYRSRRITTTEGALRMAEALLAKPEPT